MRMVNKALVFFALVGVLLLAVGLYIPSLRAQADPGALAANVDIQLPFTPTKITIYDFPVDASTESSMTLAGAALLGLLVIIKIILSDPRKILADLRTKQEVHSELKKMNDTLEGLKKIGN